MKHMWKKNQIIITALAALVAVAGYLNYSGTKLGENALPASTTETEVTLTDIDSLDQDITLTDSADGEVYLGEAAAGETDGMSDASLSAGETDAGTDTASEEVTDTPGEAVLTSTGTGSSFAAQAKLTREQVRSKNKETLLEIINNETKCSQRYDRPHRERRKRSGSGASARIQRIYRCSRKYHRRQRRCGHRTE